MHDTMADGADGIGANFFLQQINKQRNTGDVIGRVNAALVVPVREDVLERQPRAGQSDAVELAAEYQRERFNRLEEREAKARRTAVYGQDGAHWFRFQLLLSGFCATTVPGCASPPDSSAAILSRRRR